MTFVLIFLKIPLQIQAPNNMATNKSFCVIHDPLCWNMTFVLNY